MPLQQGEPHPGPGPVGGEAGLPCHVKGVDAFHHGVDDLLLAGLEELGELRGPVEAGAWFEQVSEGLHQIGLGVGVVHLVDQAEPGAGPGQVGGRREVLDAG